MASQFTVNLLPKDIQQVALFLDVDGTLYDIENSPSLIKPCFKLQKKLHTVREQQKSKTNTLKPMLLKSAANGTAKKSIKLFTV